MLVPSIIIHYNYIIYIYIHIYPVSHIPLEKPALWRTLPVELQGHSAEGSGGAARLQPLFSASPWKKWGKNTVFLEKMEKHWKKLGKMWKNWKNMGTNRDKLENNGKKW